MKRQLHFKVETTSFVNFKSMKKILCWNNIDFGLALKKFLCFNPWEFVIFILSLITAFQRWSNVVISTFKWTSKFNVEPTFILVDIKKIFVLMLWFFRNYNFYTNVEKITHNSTSKQQHCMYVKWTSKFNVDFGWH